MLGQFDLGQFDDTYPACGSRKQKVLESDYCASYYVHEGKDDLYPAAVVATLA